MRVDNQEIIDIGIVYHGHSKKSYIEVLLENCRIPIKKSELNLLRGIRPELCVTTTDGAKGHGIGGDDRKTKVQPNE